MLFLKYFPFSFSWPPTLMTVSTAEKQENKPTFFVTWISCCSNNVICSPAIRIWIQKTSAVPSNTVLYVPKVVSAKESKSYCTKRGLQSMLHSVIFNSLNLNIWYYVNNQVDNTIIILVQCHLVSMAMYISAPSFAMYLYQAQSVYQVLGNFMHF